MCKKQESDKISDIISNNGFFKSTPYHEREKPAWELYCANAKLLDNVLAFHVQILERDTESKMVFKLRMEELKNKIAITEAIQRLVLFWRVVISLTHDDTQLVTYLRYKIFKF